MLEDGLTYPIEGESAVARILIGGVLGFLSVLVIPAFALLGYSVWVLAGAARGETEPPAFEDWGRMIADGVKATLVALVYGIVPFVLVFVSIFVIAGGVGSGSDAAAGLLGGVGLLGMLVGFIAMVVLYYVIPAALTNMALEGSLGAAFDVGTIKRAVLSVDYLVAWLVPFVIVFVMNLVVFALAVTVVGLVVVPFVQFYVQVAVFYMFGAAFGKVVGVPRTAGGSAEATPV